MNLMKNYLKLNLILNVRIRIWYMRNKCFDEDINKINEIREISSKARPPKYNDACLMNLEAYILSENFINYINAFKKIMQALQKSGSVRIFIGKDKY